MSTTVYQRKVQLATPSSVWSPPAQAPARVVPEPPLEHLRAPIRDIVLRPPTTGETVMVAHARKEGDLRDLFARLTVLEARALHRRLERAGADDRLAALFQRLAPDRRRRLLAFLADARRREATRGLRR
jgi:hypothetical protein